MVLLPMGMMWSAQSCVLVSVMASLVAILDLKGKPLIQRSYRDDVPPSYIERFLPLILEFEEEETTVTPCFTHQGINYLHIRHSNLYLLALSKGNSNAAEIILFLQRLCSVLIEYFKELEEESIRDNFVIIYELLDEVMDFGYPQTTESKILQESVRRSPGYISHLTSCLQIHNPRVSQTRRNRSSRSNKRRLLAFRRHPISQKRSLLRCHRICQPPRQRQWQCHPLRNPRRRQDEMFPEWNARATLGPK
jgi:hypothetical protein